MAYNNKLAAAIKVNGKVLREFNKDTVLIPFGTEYSILIKNMHTVRALVNVYIDGRNVTEGGLVIFPGRETTLERGIDNGNLTVGNKFKFIERTGAVEEHRGVKLEDGLVRIEYSFEFKTPPLQQYYGGVLYDSFHTNKHYATNNVSGSMLSNVSGSSHSLIAPTGAGSISSYVAQNAASATAVKPSVTQGQVNAAYAAQAQASAKTTRSVDSVPENDAGITVAGSKSDQKFEYAASFMTDGFNHVMIFKLLGETESNKVITQPVTVAAKPKCTSCGRQNKATAKFCTECGTHLQIFA